MKLTDDAIIKALIEGKRITSKSHIIDGWCVMLDKEDNDLIYMHMADYVSRKVEIDIYLLIADDWEVIDECRLI